MKENIKYTKGAVNLILFVRATIGRPLIFSDDFGGHAMVAPTNNIQVLYKN